MNQLHTATVDTAAAADEPVADPTGQLLLLPNAPALAESTEHARFRLSRETRELGLRHVAEIRARLAARDHGAETDGAAEGNIVNLPPKRRPAA